MLADFDRLLPLYHYVENNGSLEPRSDIYDLPFWFKPGCTDKPGQTTAQLAQNPIDVTLRHNVMQKALHDKLVSTFGADNVGTEQTFGAGTRVDVVVKHPNSYWFYEIKTSHSPRVCIREAIGQLFEYSHWPNAQKAVKLFVVGETALDRDGKTYLSLLRKKYSLPFEYEQIVIPKQ